MGIINGNKGRESGFYLVDFFIPDVGFDKFKNNGLNGDGGRFNFLAGKGEGDDIKSAVGDGRLGHCSGDISRQAIDHDIYFFHL